MTSSPSSVVIHGHFYQPPRDDPWLEMVEAQPSAAPYHDWNERVTNECYRAVVAARVLGEGGRIADIVNTLERISFNFGPTLLEWMEMEAPSVYRAILEADSVSASRCSGHGNAIAQAYHHTILPLASRREKTIEVRWGITDFQRRFGRPPAGMWLPETAVDTETLEVLAEAGIAFTILAPHQVTKAPPRGLPGLFRTSGGRSIALFIYNGPLSHGVAFGSLLRDSEGWWKDVRTATEMDPGGLVSIATDGETYGHHHHFGEMALAAVLDHLHRDPAIQVENFASFLSRNPPRHEVELVEPSSWSCAHGVERWRSHCGCKMDPTADTQQKWRSKLREAMEWLASQIHRVFEAEGPELLGDPWRALEGYGSGLTGDIRDPRGLELLEMERQALRLFTSCGWFFDDLAGIEPIQVLRYAARALEVTGSGRQEIESGFLRRLEKAFSNETPPRSGRTIFLEEASRGVPAHLAVAGGASLWDAVRASVEDLRQAADPLPSIPLGGEDPSSEPRVPGFHATKAGPTRFLVTHRRTGRRWTIEARIPRPSHGRGAVAVRSTHDAGPFVALEIQDLPESYRLAIEGVLRSVVSSPETSLLSALRALGEDSGTDAERSRALVDQVRDLVDLHVLLDEGIPFDVQTEFMRLFKKSSPALRQSLAALRGPLGFTTSP